jgi:sugar lactone lactonase YvrE
MTIDPQGNLYVVDSGADAVRMISTSGTIRTVAGRPHYSGDGGPAASALLRRPQGVAVGADGTVFFSDSDNHRIRKIAPDGTIATVAGTGNPGYTSGGGDPLKAELQSPRHLALDGAGNLYFVDRYASVVRRLTAKGVFSTLVGNGVGVAGTGKVSPDGIAAISADFSFICGLAVDAAGTVYFSDYAAHKVRKVDAGGSLVTVAGTGTAGFSGDGG